MGDTTALDILCISYNSSEPSISISWDWLCLILIILFISLVKLLIYLIRKKKGRNIFAGKETLKVKIGSIEYTQEIVKSHENKYIANRIYIELITRKAAIPVDEENDVIKEIYSSWYTLFTTIRNEIKSIPGLEINGSNSNHLIELTTDILNEGLRPHLTKYQARFLKWYDEELNDEKNEGKDPQEIQKNYKHYNELIADIKSVNQILIDYSEQLKKLIS